MKKGITKIWGVGLVLVLAVSLLLSAAPVSAGTLSWSKEVIPSSTGNVLEPASSLYDLDIADDGTMYSVNASTMMWKSTNGGLTWSGITTPADCDADLVAVAPDDGDLVAFWGGDSANLTVYVSTNGGTTWGALGTPQEGTTGGTPVVINDMAISAGDAGVHYIALAGNETGDVANVWWFNTGAAAPAWKETNDKAGFASNDLDEFGTGETDAYAVAFSPAFASDKVMTAVTANATVDTTFQMFSLSTKKWNNAAGYGTSWPIEILNDTASIDDSIAASISLTPEYLGGDEATRIAFVGISATTPALGGVIRCKDYSIKTIKDAVSVNSVAFDGTNFVAGSRTNNDIWRSADPLASTPTFTTTSGLKQPGTDGCTNVIVAWRDSDVMAGTQGTGSAFSISRDNGKSFNDISLIDTAGSNLGATYDVTVSADGSVVYMLAYDANATSLWRKASSWERVLSIAAATGYIVRIAPDDPDVVYVALTGSTRVYYSNEGGDTKWFTRISRYNIQDMAVEGDGSVAYIAVDGTKSVSSTTNAGFTWNTSKSSGVSGNSIHMIASLGEDKLIVGSDQGYVAWSTDGNSSWSNVSTQLNTAGNTQVTASGLDTGDFIYASAETPSATASLMERWEIGQDGTSWKDLAPTFSSVNYTAFGIALADGVLYLMTEDTNGNNSEVLRTLSPTTAEPSAAGWSAMPSAAEAFSRPPTSLRVSTGNKLWAVDSASPTLWSYTDTLSAAGPTLVSPTHGSSVQINPVSGKSYQVAFSWDRPSKGKIYQLRFALDYDFTEKVQTFTSASTTDNPASLVVGPSASNDMEFMPGITYYWYVRVAIDGPIYSPWSAIRMITIDELPEAVPPVIIQPAPAPIITLPAPVITVPPAQPAPPAPIITLPAPQVILPPAPAPVAPVPQWAILAIIIIGAILVIAVIVLIVRTRRPV